MIKKNKKHWVWQYKHRTFLCKLFVKPFLYRLFHWIESDITQMNLHRNFTSCVSWMRLNISSNIIMLHAFLFTTSVKIFSLPFLAEKDLVGFPFYGIKILVTLYSMVLYVNANMNLQWPILLQHLLILNNVNFYIN